MAKPPTRDGGDATGFRLGYELVLTVLFIAVLAVAVLTIEPLRTAFGDALSGDTEKLRDDLRDLGAAGIALLYGLIAIHTFVWYPAEILDAAAGFVYGFWPAFVMVMAGWVMQGLAAYWFGRAAARPVLYGFVGAERFKALEHAVERGGVTLLLAARLVPIVPFSLFSYVAGAAHVPVWRFAWTTGVGYVPITALSIYLGSQLEELSPTHPAVLAFAVVLLGLLLFARRLKPLFGDTGPGAAGTSRSTLGDKPEPAPEPE